MSRQPVRIRRLVAPFLSILFLICVAGESQASFSVSGSETQTVSGENFNFLFAGLPQPFDGSGGTLTIRARGDYGKSTPDEFVTWDFDSLGIGGDIGPVLGATIIAEYPPAPFNDTEWTQSFAISSPDLFTALVDDAVSIDVNLNFENFLGVNCCFSDTGIPFVEVALEYRPVPEPTGALLFAIGFGAIGWGCNSRAR